MKIIKQIIKLLLYGFALGLMSVSINYAYNELDMPKSLTISVLILLLMLHTVVTKWKKLPNENLTAIAIFIGGVIIYIVATVIDHYVKDFFMPNIYWMVSSFLPAFLYMVIIGQREERNSKSDD